MRITTLIVLVLFFNNLFSQKFLELNYQSFFGKEKSFQFYNNSEFEYKLKGDFLYRKQKLVNMNDSILVFENDVIVKINQLKSIKITGANISHWFFVAALGFFIIDTGNNIANGNATIIHQQVIVATTVGVLAGLIVKRIQDKHVYMRKHVCIKIVDADYENLNNK